jgi:hypothetical protein
MRTTSTALGVDIGFFSMPTRSIASAAYATSSSTPIGSITAIATWIIPGKYTWTVPADVTSIYATVTSGQGGGGGGGTGSTLNAIS